METEFPDSGFDEFVRIQGLQVPHVYTVEQYPSYAAMRADYMRSGLIRVNTDHSEGTIFGSPEVNWLFRAWHDWCHLEADSDFSLAGELAAMRLQIRDIMGTGWLSSDEKQRYSAYVRAEVEGQLRLYLISGQFPIDQRAFARDWLRTHI